MSTKQNGKLEWCIVELGKDMNWWVKDISDTVHWDVDGLSILDPRQLNHILDLADPLREYGFTPELFEEAFFTFKIDKEVSNGRVRLTRSIEPLLESEDALFTLPNNLDEDKSPYADLLDNLTKARVQMLNDLLEFEESLTVEELEEEIREQHNNEYFEGRQVHAFDEITSILEYVPAGFELDSDVKEESKPKAVEDEVFPDIEEEEIEEDETMRWDEDEEEEDDDFFNDDEENDDEEEEEEEEEEDRPRRR